MALRTSPRTRGTTAVALAVAAALSLAACGSGDSGSSAYSGKSDNGSGSKAVAQGGEDFAKAASQTAKMGTTAKAGQFPRTIEHAMGKTEIKAQPKRVVVLDVGELDNVASLGVKPVGYAPTEGDDGVPSYLKKTAGTPKDVGTINSLNLEAIANLHPDLILGSELRAAKLYPQLSKIAPTVFSIRPGFTWKENYLLNASALDKTAEAKANLAAYEKKAKKLGDDIGEKKPTVTMLRYMPGMIRLYAKASFIGTILDDAADPAPQEPAGRGPRHGGQPGEDRPGRRRLDLHRCLRRREEDRPRHRRGQPAVEEARRGEERTGQGRPGRDLVPGARCHGGEPGPRRPARLPRQVADCRWPVAVREPVPPPAAAVREPGPTGHGGKVAFHRAPSV